MWATYQFLCSRRSLVPLIVGLFTAGYFAATISLALLKPFAFDEFLTYNIARMPTSGDVWRAWLEAFDGMPVVTHLTTHAVGTAFGFSEVTTRLPAMVGFWLMCVCVFLFLLRRMSPLLALVGMLLPLTVAPVYAFAYEARGYGMVLGFSGAAMVCWDLADHMRWRRVALLGLPICLAAAIETHFYAVLLVVPLSLGELARTMQRRQVNWFVWVGLVAGGLVLLPANPILSHIRGLSVVGAFPHRLHVSELLELWSEFLSASVTYLGLFGLVCLCRQFVSTVDVSPSLIAQEERASVADWVLVVGWIALPAVGFVLANLTTGVLLFRYLIVTIIGFSLGIPFLCQLGITRRPEIAILLAGWVAISAVGGTMASRYVMRTKMVSMEHVAARSGCFRLMNLWERLPPDGLPIVLTDLNFFHQFHHYAPAALKQRLVFAVDHEFLQVIEPYVPFYVRVFGERMDGLEDFLRSNRSFYVYDCHTPARLPLVQKLLDAGASLRAAGLGETPQALLRQDLYRVSMPDGAATSSRDH